MKNKQKLSTSIIPRKILLYLLSVTGVLFLAHIGLQYLNLEVFYQQNGQVYELSNRFDFDDEVSVPTWWAQILFLLFAAAAFIASRVEKVKSLRNLWILFGVIGVLFSVDEGAGLHEFLLQTIHVLLYAEADPTKSSNAWLVVLPFILIFGAYIVWKMWNVLPSRTILLFVAAGGVFISGAVFVDLITSASERETFLNQGIYVGIEEVMELVGINLAIYAVVDHLSRARVALPFMHRS